MVWKENKNKDLIIIEKKGKDIVLGRKYIKNGNTVEVKEDSLDEQ